MFIPYLEVIVSSSGNGKGTDKRIPFTGLERPRWFQDVEAPRFHDP
jgi:hypothetical protein